MTSTSSDDEQKWLKRSWPWLGAMVMSVVGLVWLVFFSPVICTNELGGENSDLSVKVCHAVQLTDPVVIAWAVIVLLLLWGTLSEGSIAGLFSFKKQVDKAVSDSEQAKQTAERALLHVSQSVNNTVMVHGVPSGVWRGESLKAVDGTDTSTSRENLIAGKLAELAIGTILARLIFDTGLDPAVTAAHIYTHADDQLSRADAPVDPRSRTWPVGVGAVGAAWEQRVYVVQTQDDPGFITSPDYPISAVAAMPILNASRRPIGVLSLHSRAEPPPDLNSKLVFDAMIAAAELMARVFVNLAGWDKDSSTA